MFDGVFAIQAIQRRILMMNVHLQLGKSLIEEAVSSVDVA